jgi:2',3'-cyclic-nucleotide 2'-phosphodiesterase (5'-nucleotidase family)
MNTMGYDAVALGNHDYFMGQDDLNWVVGEAKPDFPLLSANFIHSRKLKNLNRYMKPYVFIDKAGVRFAIIGLVTDGIAWAWRAGPHVLADPQRVLDGYIDELDKQSDYVVVLSHLGYPADKNLVGFSSGVDLVVGGHSHTKLTQPTMQEDFFGKQVPIVQAGQHGDWVGRLVVDVEKGQPLKVVSYELVEIRNDGPRDPRVAAEIQVAKDRLDNQYGDRWLHEPIGYSEVPMVVPRTSMTPWGRLANEAMKRAAGTDLALDDLGGAIYGDNMEGGVITREKLFRFYARVFNLREHFGWTVWTLDVRGWALKAVIQFTMDAGYVVAPVGVTYKSTHDGSNGWVISDLRVNGHLVSDTELLSVAVPEGIGMAIRDAFPPTRIWLHHPHDTRVPIWKALEAELARRGGIVRASD